MRAAATEEDDNNNKWSTEKKESAEKGRDKRGRNMMREWRRHVLYCTIFSKLPTKVSYSILQTALKQMLPAEHVLAHVQADGIDAVDILFQGERIHQLKWSTILAFPDSAVAAMMPSISTITTQCIGIPIVQNSGSDDADGYNVLLS